MSFQEPIRKKKSSPFNRTPAPNPLQRRRFKVPKPPEKVVRRSPEEQKAFLQQKLEQAAFVGYNGLNVPVKASETPPPQPIQQKPASGGSEDNSQPQEVPDVEATSEQVEETVESEKQQSSAAASQGQESSETEGVTPPGESEAETQKPQSQIPDLQAQKERASRLSSNWLKVPVNAPGKEPSSVQRKLPQKGLETQYQPLLGQRTNLRLNGLNRLTSETPVQTKRETPSDDTQEGISESETLEETETESDAVADTKSTSAAAENEPDREPARNQPESNSQAKRKVAIQDEKGKDKNADTDSANTDKSQAENSKSESTNPDVASAKTANQDAQKAVEAVTETETAETTENLGEPETKTEAGAKEETATAQAGEQESPDATGDTPKQTPTDEEKVDQNAVAKVTTQKEQVAGKQAEAARAVAQTSSQIETAAANSQPPTNTGIAFTPPQIKPTFVTTEAGIAALNPQKVLGAAGNGMVVCQTDNPQASLTAANQGIVAHPIPEAQVASSMEQQRLQAEAAMSQFMASGSQRVASIGSLGQTIAPRIQASAGQAVAAVDMAISQNQATITNAMAQARSHVQTQAQGAKQEVTGQHQATVGAVKSSTTAARDRIQTEYQTSLAQLQQIETGMASGIAKPFTKAAQDFRAAGVTVGKEAIQIGNDYQKQFAGESPPEPSNFITEFLESFDRETYVENWRQAKIKAAGDVAASYRDGLQQNANEKAAELSTSQSEVVKGMQQVVATTRNELHLQYKAALQELAQSEKSALNRASQALKGQLQSIDQNLNATLSSLDQMQATQLTQLNSLGEQQKLGINANAEQVTAALQAGVNQATTNVQGAFQQFADQAQGMETPNLPVVNAVIAEAQGQLDGMMAATQASLETGISNSEQGIDQQTQEMLGSINTVTQQASAAGTTVAEEFNTTIAQEVQRASQAFTQLQNGHTNGVNSRADTTVGELKNLTAGVQQQLDGVIKNLNTKLAESTTQLENGLRGSLKGSDQNPSLGQTIQEKAQEAADQVQPAWKSVVKILIDIVITVAVTVAIVALAASGVGLVAAIGLAALIGATGALVKQGANDLIDGKMSSWQTYATQAGFGAVGGVLQLVGLRGAEKAAGLLTNTATKAGAKFGIESLGEMGADISQRLAVGEAFSLSMVGISFGTSLLGNAGGEALSGAFGKLGTKLGVDQIDNAAFKTGGEFVTDTIGETATDVTGQVVFEDKELSWQTVGESAGTSAFGNLVGRGANRAYGDRLRNLGGGDRPSTDVPNLNQPLPPVGDISNPTPIVDPNTNQPVGQTPPSTPIVDPNTNQPVGQTPAPTPIIDPNTNQPIGQTPPSTPIKDEGLTQIPSDQIKDTSLNPDLQKTLTAALPNDLQGKVAINVDPDLPSNTVRVHYDVDANGLVTNVHMRVGLDASAVDIQLHTQTVRLMQRYSGFSGRIRLLKERIQNWISKNGTPPVGSRAWEAKLEVEKLPRIIDERLERLGTGDLDVDAEANLRADIENLQQQLTQHQNTLDEMDVNPGVGFVAADANKPGKQTNQPQESQPKKSEDEGLQDLNAALNLRLSRQQQEYLRGNTEGNPLTKTQINKLMDHAQNDWQQVKANYLQYPQLMQQLVDYRQKEVQKVINEIKKGHQDVEVVFRDKGSGGPIRQIAAGSADLSSDYDIVFYSRNKDKKNRAIQAIEAVQNFNALFRSKFGREAGLVFDTNVYTPGFIPDAAYSPTATRLSKLQNLQKTFDETDTANQTLKEKEQALRDLDEQDNNQESQTKRAELEAEITKIQAKIDSLNQKATKLKTEIRKLTKDLKLQPGNLDSPTVVQHEIKRFSEDLNKQYESEKKRNAAADAETDAIVVADQDVMSLAQQRRNMTDQEWNKFQEETLAGIESGSDLHSQTSDRFQKANDVYTGIRAELDAKIVELNKQKELEYSDPTKQKVEPEDDVEAIKAQNPNAEIEASNLLYTQRLQEVKAILKELEPLRDKRNEPLNQQKKERLNQLTVEWNKKQSEALIFANQAYYTGGAAQHVVGNQQMSLGRKLSPEEYLNSFNEQVSYALEHITDHEGLGHSLWTSGKYLDRATDAVDQLTQIENLLESSPIEFEESTKNRVTGMREMAQQMLKIKKGKDEYADLSPDQKAEKAIEVAQEYQTEYGLDLQDINGMRQELISLSIEINKQVRRQGESYKAKNSFDQEGSHQQNPPPTSEVNPSENQSNHDNESPTETTVTNPRANKEQDKTGLEPESQLKTDKNNEQGQELNHPGVELHNHFTGILKPAKLIELTGKQPSEILTDLWNNTSGSTKTVIGEVLKNNGILQADGESLNLSNSKVVKVTLLELLTATTIPFDETYRIRGSVLLSTTPEQQVRSTLEQLKADGIKYAELQGGLPRGIDPEQFRALLEEYGLEVRFLYIISSERLASEHPIKEQHLIATPERRALEQVGNGQTIGIDIAGAERRFTSEGMKRFKKIYEELKQKAIEQKSTFVLRPHVGEGYPQRDSTGQLDKSSDEHRTIAQKNLENLITTLEELKANNQLSDQVIVRLGHATHATPEQLTRIQQLGIIVEANLTSNLVTQTVADPVEQNQVLLKFLFHDVKTILNTDAGGVMNTSLQREYELAHTILSRFNTNEIPIVVDNVHYYFSEIPDEGDRDPGVEYRILPGEKRENFDIERLKQEAEGYSQKM